MKRHIPGLHCEDRNEEEILEGIFLVRVEHALYRWHPQRPFFVIRFAVLKPELQLDSTVTGRLYCTPKALWKLTWFLRDFGYDRDLIGRDEIEEKVLTGLRGVLRTSRTTLNGRSLVNFDAFAPSGEWEEQLRGHS